MTGPAGVTVVDETHGSFLTCRVRLGCTDPDHAARRRAYNADLSRRRRRAQGMNPMKRGRTHGRRSTYRVCHDGPGGGPCGPCRDAEREYVAAWRRRTGRITGAKRGPKPRGSARVE